MFFLASTHQTKKHQGFRDVPGHSLDPPLKRRRTAGQGNGEMDWDDLQDVTHSFWTVSL